MLRKFTFNIEATIPCASLFSVLGFLPDHEEISLWLSDAIERALDAFRIRAVDSIHGSRVRNGKRIGRCNRHWLGPVSNGSSTTFGDIPMRT